MILTAEVGEGHVAAARVLADELRTAADDVDVFVVDALAAFGGVLRFLLRDAYRVQLRQTPWVFGALFSAFLHVRPLRAGGRLALAFLGARGLERTLNRYRPDIVVSTYPAATSVLGTLRRRRRVTVPTCATVTDLGGIAFWSHPYIDLHLVMHPALVRLVEREAGPGSVVVVRPLVAPAFFEQRSRSAARSGLNVSPDRRLVVVSGGGWAVGDLHGATKEALAVPNATVICLAGRDETTRERLTKTFAGNEQVVVLGFTDRMPELLAAADVLVHTTGGVTCLEAFAAGCPVVAYGAPAGHGPALARAMASLGVVSHVRKRAALGAALAAAAPAAATWASASAARAVLSARIRAERAPIWRRRLRMGAFAAGLAAALLFAGASETAFALVASDLDLAPVSRLPTALPRVGLVIETSQLGAPALSELVAARGDSASFAFIRLPPAQIARELTDRHDGVIVALRPAGIDDWVGTADHLLDTPVSLRVHPFFVLAPASGLSAGQYMLARLVGAKVVKGRDVLVSGSSVPRAIPRGSIVVAALGASGPGREEIERLLASLARNGLQAVSLATLASTST